MSLLRIPLEPSTLNPFTHIHESGWTYKTAASGGAGIEFVIGTGGAFWLYNPQGKEERFLYGGLGVGYSTPKLRPKGMPNIAAPKIRGNSVSGGGAPKFFPSFGKVYKLPGCTAPELAHDDFQGATIFLDAGVAVGLGIGVGANAAVMLLGIETALLALGLSMPGLNLAAVQAIQRAPALLVTAGLNAGVTGSGFGGGAGVLAGYVH